ncbi:uncharacterized protein LOC120906435 isoform X1 [Anopheles arabiensis]|uniref:uncharacterized protein LOC120906435 isoform X1 n=1 Tax=Anopheles arabiensis TaxID=7173 RepID=UPI001AAD010E|nr:uncharacterized protein LOC120906435 isoform X1 [Anopheles arabiensis]XP_040174053.1 uncharacterized protein LOC120906435 isoform X1 [Anopheles arabiensis]XP_040174054.1 uncharacterized protein LOC120906435 isoform X1 [Anopheles arabiensis]
MENKNKNVSIVDENGNPGKRPLSMLRNFEKEEETTLDSGNAKKQQKEQPSGTMKNYIVFPNGQKLEIRGTICGAVNLDQTVCAKPLDANPSSTQTQQTIFLKTAGATPCTSKPVQQPLDVKKTAGKPHPVTHTQQTIFLKTAGATPSTSKPVQQPLDVKKSAGKPHPVTQTQQTIFLKTAGATPSTSKPVQQPLDVKKSAGKPGPVTQTQQTIFSKTAGATPSPSKPSLQEQPMVNTELSGGLLDPDDTPFLITKNILRQLIRDEVTSVLQEQRDSFMEPMFRRMAGMEATFASLYNQISSQTNQTNVDPKVLENFEFDTIDSGEALTELDERLKNDDQYKNTFVAWVQRYINVPISTKRMSKLLKALFTPKFLCLLTWSGRGKRAMYTLSNYKGIIDLFKTVGSTELSKVGDREVADFFILKLRYATYYLSRQECNQTNR